MAADRSLDWLEQQQPLTLTFPSLLLVTFNPLVTERFGATGAASASVGSVVLATFMVKPLCLFIAIASGAELAVLGAVPLAPVILVVLVVVEVVVVVLVVVIEGQAEESNVV